MLGLGIIFNSYSHFLRDSVYHLLLWIHMIMNLWWMMAFLCLQKYDRQTLQNKVMHISRITAFKALAYPILLSPRNNLFLLIFKVILNTSHLQSPFSPKFFFLRQQTDNCMLWYCLRKMNNFQKLTSIDLDHIWFQAYAHENIPILEEIQTRVYKHMVKVILNPCGTLGL